MNGAHAVARRPRSRVHALLVAAAVSGGLAALGGFIYVLVAGSTLAVWTVITCLYVGFLGVTVKRRLWPSVDDEEDEDDDDADGIPIWFAAVWLLIPVTQWLSTFAGERHWPAGQQHTINFAGDWVARPVLLGAVAILLWLDGRRWLRRRRSRLSAS